MTRISTDAPFSADTDDGYAAIAELYDIEHQHFSADIELYRQFAYSTGDPILEVSCGSGRVLIPLAQDGHRVTGTDRSTAMLDRARTAANVAGVMDRVRLVEADMTEAQQAEGGPFGFVIVPLNGLLHLTEQHQQRAFLRSARTALDPRGHLMIDVFNPTPDHVRALEGTALDGCWDLPNGDRVMKFSHRRVKLSEQLIETDLWYDRVTSDGTISRTTTSFTMRYITAAELTLLLELEGYVEWELYGSYDLDPFDDTSDRLIVTAEVTASHS